MNLIDQWVGAINRSDAGAVAALFGANALFMGSQPAPLVSRASIEDYYLGIPRGLKVKATLVEAQAPSPDLIVATIAATFSVPDQDERIAMIALAVRRDDEDWLIALYQLRWM
ncbi:SgcJ/EcaC family oxidoreductase [Rhizobium sp. FY34]|uniref:YybH family protein n=1 Tax=Rhizobium sp. FY34 TaxID=2562309 RepID=UPI0010C0FC9B|nr:SgcJ/EcaC family oxidoreductase [Rhizobium sp. FY34]